MGFTSKLDDIHEVFVEHVYPLDMKLHKLMFSLKTMLFQEDVMFAISVRTNMKYSSMSIMNIQCNFVVC